MKSIGVRLAFWYALSATLTMAVLFAAGYQLLERHLIHGLDLLNESEFQQIQAHLGPDYVNLEPEIIEQRIRETTEFASVLFYINLQTPENRVLFSSHNLMNQAIPDVPGQANYNTDLPNIGEIRASEFVLKPFDVVIATSLTQVRTVMRGYIEVGVGLLAVMLAASTAIGLGLSRLLLQPLRLIRETASRIGSDTLDERIPVADVEDEMSDLARLLNLMFDRLEDAFHQIRRFASEASHELKTPLSLIRLHGEKLLADGKLSPEQEDAVLVQLEELGRLNRIIDEMLFLSRAEAKAIELSLAEQNPRDFLDNFSHDAQVLAEHHRCIFALHHHGQGLVAFEGKWLRQVLLNLLTNALNVSSEGSRVTLDSEVDNEQWRVSLTDQGPGLNEEQRERIFERFVRIPGTQRGGEDRGSGLGLAICRSIVALHRGRIFAEASPLGPGLRVIFEIPRFQVADRKRV